MTELRLEVEQEDERFREAIKGAAYEYESHGDPRILQRHIEELIEGSKSRQREIFAKHGYGEALNAPHPPKTSETTQKRW